MSKVSLPPGLIEPASTLEDVEVQIDDWVSTGSGPWFEGAVVKPPPDDTEEAPLYVLKFTRPEYLASTLKSQELYISQTPGYTWGDAVYLSPLAFPYSNMAYGRVGIMGAVPDWRSLRVFVADSAHGIPLYQKWITFFPRTFSLLTTTVHASAANRDLRNDFRRRFSIDIVLFRPDESGEHYTAVNRDWWIALSDWSAIDTGSIGSRRVDDLRWVAVVGESFTEGSPLLLREAFLRRLNHRLTFGDGPDSTNMATHMAREQQLVSALTAAYARNAADPFDVVSVRSNG